ncbi:MAG: signal transduction histidine kinase/DNA-binding NarL/FixJ family response regulator [Flavobacteriaceae bacterium]|jgi:signal transduction histidine kinase/DNA-binding NarL/FixJ family response regulator/ligand-binding sensor domain-containing protein
MMKDKIISKCGLLILCTFLLYAGCGNVAISQQGRPFISNFTPVSYHSDEYTSSPQNWCIDQDIDGKMVVANSSGILVFNGTNWQMIAGTEDKWFFKMAKDANGQIYTGGTDDLGVLKANEQGTLEFHSLLNELKQEERDFGRILNVVSHNGTVFFRSNSSLIRYSNGNFKSWKGAHDFGKMVSSSAGLFIADHGNWYKIEDDSLHVIATSDEQALPNWVGVFEGPEDKLLIATLYRGFYHLEDSKLVSIESSFEKLTMKNGTQITKNKFALTTDEHGVIIVNKQGDVIDVINKSMGLSENGAIFPYYNNGSLWLAMNSGISLIEYPIQTSMLNQENGLNSFPVCTEKLDDRLFLGTYEGAFWVDREERTEQARILPSNESLTILAARNINGNLLVSNSKGIRVHREDGRTFQSSAPFNTECQAVIPSSTQRNSIYAVFSDKIVYMHLGANSLDPLAQSIQVPHLVYSMAEEPSGKLWAAYDGLSFIDFSRGKDNPDVLTLNQSHGIKKGMEFFEVGSIDGKVLIGTELGVYSYNASTKKIEPNPIFGSEFCDGSTGAYNLTEMRNGDVWITTDRQTGLLIKQKNGSFIYDSLPLMRAPISDVWDVFEDENEIVWICGTEAIVRYDPSINVHHSASYKAFIRSVVINDHDELFAGSYGDKNGVQTSKQPESYIPTLTYDRNSITFKFGAANFATDQKLEYSIILVGKDEEWSSWRTSGETNYNNLEEGRYTFRVKSKDVYGNISEEASYSFVILSPWYRTAWAYALFVVGGILILFVVVKLNSRRLMKENLKLEHVITERTQEVRKQKERAEQSEQFKQQFLANMSHEIRTPMNAVIGMTDLALDSSVVKKRNFYLGGIKKSGENLLHIINDILDLSKIEAGKMELEEIDFSLPDLLNQVKQTLSHRADEKELDLILKMKPGVDEVVLGDPVRLNQVLINLAGNAIKFTEKGSVAIVVERIGETTKFSIEDTGIGIPEDKLKTVFENFGQANTSDTRKYGGTGLGLSISQQLVELMGGRIDVKSKAGAGTTFFFDVAIDGGSAEKLEKRLAAEKNVDGSILNGLCILIVDDNEYNRIVASDTITTKSEVRILEAENGEEAIKVLSENDVDVILMDAQMPVMNGYEATKYIRSEMAAPKNQVPVLALTANVLRTELDKCSEAGMNGFIPKPFKPQQLILGIAQALNISLKHKDETENENKQTVTNEGVSNLDYLTKFCDGDKAKMKRYVDMFIAGAEPLNLEIIEAVKKNDPIVLANKVHGYMTRFIMMGMSRTKAVSVEIENACRDGQEISELTDKIEFLKSQLKTAIEELSQFDSNK